MAPLLYPDQGRWYPLSKNPEIYSWSLAQDRFFDLRMIALRLKDQSLLVYSPLPLSPDQDFRALDSLGKVSHLLAPNHFHNLGIKPFYRRYPQATLWCAPLAAKRLKSQTSLVFSDCANLAPLLPEGVSLVQPAGLKTGEVWIKVDSRDGGRILMVCDSFFNMPPQRRGLFGMVLRLTGGAPGLRVSKVFGVIAVSQQAVYRQWLKAFVDQWQPQTLVPSHGDLLTDESLGSKLVGLV